MEAVKTRLIGPESARFRNVRIVSASLVCGEVAAMNAAREYVGWRRFAAQGGVAFIAPDSLPLACR